MSDYKYYIKRSENKCGIYTKDEKTNKEILVISSTDRLGLSKEVALLIEAFNT